MRIKVDYWCNIRRTWVISNKSDNYYSRDTLNAVLLPNNNTEYRARWDENDAWHYIGSGPQIHTDDYIETPLENTYKKYLATKQYEEDKENEIMLNSSSASSASSASSPSPSTPDSFVDIRITRDDGKLTLSINAKPLHDMLDSVGAKHAGGNYEDRPQTNFSGISSTNKLSTDLFLKRVYPVKVALNSHYTKPPSLADLKALCESGHSAVKSILTHYQPIDISYTIQKLIK